MPAPSSRPLADAWDRPPAAEPSGFFAWLAQHWARFALRPAALGAGVQVFGRPVVHAADGSTFQVGAGARIVARSARTRFEVGPEAKLQVGSGALLDDVALVQVYGGVAIGSGAYLGPGVRLLDQRGLPGERPARILIGAEAQIGAGATIMGGVQVGRGAVVAAGAWVTENVPAGATAAAVPPEAPGAAQQAGAQSEPVSDAPEAEAAEASALAAPVPPPPSGDGAAQRETDPVVRLATGAPVQPAEGDVPVAETDGGKAEAGAAPEAAAEAENEEVPADAPPVWPPHARLRS